MRTLDSTRHDYAAAGMAPFPSSVKAQLHRMLAAEDRGGWLDHKKAGRLDRHAYAAALRGAEDVFKQRYVVEAINTAVVVLVDCSGSMAMDNKMTRAAHMSLNLTRVMRKIRGVAFCVAGFDGESQRHAGAGISHTDALGFGGKLVDLDTFNLAPPARIKVIKPWDMNATDGRIAMLAGMSNGYTPDLSAFYWAQAELLARPEARRILITITDGLSPNSNSVKLVLDNIRASDVQSVCLGLDFNPAHSYGIGMQIDSVTDFNAQGVGAIVKALGAGKAAHARSGALRELGL